jgi:hypothetical protein
VSTYSGVSNTHASAYACVSNRAPACLHGGCGGRQAGQRRGQTTRGHTYPTPARQKMCGHACKYFLFVCRKAIAPQGTKNNRPPRCNKRDRHVMEVCKTNCRSINRGCGAKQKTNKKIVQSLLCATATPSVYFTYWNEVPGAIVCPRPQTKSACTPLPPCAMPKDGRHVRWVHSRVCSVRWAYTLSFSGSCRTSKIISMWTTWLSS